MVSELPELSKQVDKILEDLSSLGDLYSDVELGESKKTTMNETKGRHETWKIWILMLVWEKRLDSSIKIFY